MRRADCPVDKAKNLFNVQFSVSGMTDWLVRNGFSYKKCQPVPSKANPVDQAQFLELYGMVKESLAKGGKLVFLDACHPTRATKIVRSWSLSGARKNIKTHAGQERVNVVGTLDPDTLDLVSTFPEKVDGASLAKHLEKLRRLSKTDAKIVVALDNGSYCRSIVLREAAEKLGMELMFLPPYAPNLNLIERVWRHMNEVARNNVSFACLNEFKQAIKKFFQVDWRSLKKTSKPRYVEKFQVI